MQDHTSFQVYNASAGSGKTFTLVKEYLQILLNSDNPFLFQSILAMTFTNKAAGEMKDRILSTLRDISLGNKNDLFVQIAHSSSFPKDVLVKRSEKILQAILYNYSTFNIITIDTFTHRLIRSFAIDLGLSVNFDIEMDTDPWRHEAVQNVISKIGIDDDISKLLIEFALQQADDDKSWDITNDLNKFSKILLNESDAANLQKLQRKPISDYLKFRKSLIAKQKEIENGLEEVGNEGLEIIEKEGVNHKDFYRSMLPNHFKKLSESFQDAKFFDQSKLKERIEERNFYPKSKSAEIKSKIESILPDLLNCYDRSEELYQLHTLNDLILKSLTPLAVLSELNKSLNEIKDDNNIKFISEFNQLISKHLVEQPAAFIYERLGERFKYFFIDEMQDTSVLQWSNLIPLIENALAEENTGLLLVGDAKQSIYRWRGGEPDQFIGLASKEEEKGPTNENLNPFNISKTVNNLETNYRSFSEIIDFNNNYFTDVSKYFLKDAHIDLYKIGNQQKFNQRSGGYVKIDFIPEKLNSENRLEIIPEMVLKIIKNLDGKLKRNEICILVRKHTQGIEIANYLTEHEIPIVSSETLLLKNDKKIDFIINLLKYLVNDDEKESKFNMLYFLYDHLSIPQSKHEFIADFIDLEKTTLFTELEKYQVFYDSASYEKLPFYEHVEQIIRSFKLTQKSDAYIQFFLDEILIFSQRKSQSINEFLDYWELKKDKLSIASIDNEDAVKISTIHKSKGLQFRVVIFPYDIKIYELNKEVKAWYALNNIEDNFGFEKFFIPSTKKIENTGIQGEEIYQDQMQMLELDNFNMIYVSFTRAIEQLYIIAESEVSGEMKTNSQFLKKYLENSGSWEEGKFEYEFGENKLKLPKDVNQESEVKSIEQKEFVSSSWKEHQLSLASNSSLLWDSERKNAVHYGNIIHEIMAKVIVKNDVENSIKHYITSGVITEKEAIGIKKLVDDIVNHKELSGYFDEDKVVLAEREILNEDGHVLIPDRLVFNDKNEVIVIDYKTGNKEKKHIYQINSYGEILEKMGYEISRKLLVYTNQNISIVSV